MVSFHNDKQIKQKYVQRMKDHINADELIRGVGFEDGKGCAVGCTLDKYDHAAYQTELGLPEWLARLEDVLFEGMSLEKSKTFPLQFLEAIPVGISLEQTYHKMQIYILEIAKSHVQKEYDYVIKAIDDVIELHLKMANGLLTGDAAWSAARSAARSARSAAESARSAVESARSAAYDQMADKLLELLQEAAD